ncbi:MAG TPA: hypothetical protein PLW81_14680, partial [Thiobacillaceae bacterium]|nr:hypothetical protein [Thiobacillaceae bacterium]
LSRPAAMATVNAPAAPAPLRTCLRWLFMQSLLVEQTHHNEIVLADGYKISLDLPVNLALLARIETVQTS